MILSYALLAAASLLTVLAVPSLAYAAEGEDASCSTVQFIFPVESDDIIPWATQLMADGNAILEDLGATWRMEAKFPNPADYEEVTIQTPDGDMTVFLPLDGSITLEQYQENMASMREEYAMCQEQHDQANAILMDLQAAANKGLDYENTPLEVVSATFYRDIGMFHIYFTKPLNHTATSLDEVIIMSGSLNQTLAGADLVDEGDLLTIMLNQTQLEDIGAVTHISIPEGAIIDVVGHSVPGGIYPVETTILVPDDWHDPLTHQLVCYGDVCEVESILTQSGDVVPSSDEGSADPDNDSHDTTEKPEDTDTPPEDTDTPPTDTDDK